MEQNKINKALLYAIIYFAIGVAVRNLLNFFSGVGITFVSLIIIGSLIVRLTFVNKENRKRFYDIYVAMILTMLFMVATYCCYDWANNVSDGVINFVTFTTNIQAISSLVFLCYTLIRYMVELGGGKLRLTEVLLGAKIGEPAKPKAPKPVKVKKVKPVVNKEPKEVKNGDLEKKPDQAEVVVEQTEDVEAKAEEINTEETKSE